jgi:hypothetical protein
VCASDCNKGAHSLMRFNIPLTRHNDVDRQRIRRSEAYQAQYDASGNHTSFKPTRPFQLGRVAIQREVITSKDGYMGKSPQHAPLSVVVHDKENHKDKHRVGRDGVQ